MIYHDEGYLDFIRSLSCLRCLNDTSTEAAHYRSSDGRIGKQNPGSRKPPDFMVLPLCGSCHRTAPDAQHTVGETAFWEGCDPVLWALYLFALYKAEADWFDAEKFVQEQASLWFQRRTLT